MRYLTFSTAADGSPRLGVLIGERVVDVAVVSDGHLPGTLLSLVQQVGAAGATAGKPVGVCGEAAADPLLACVLVGLGVTSLSAAASAASAVGDRLAGVDLKTCRSAADAALTSDDEHQARQAARAVLTGD